MLPIDQTRARLWREMERIDDVTVLADPTRSLAQSLSAKRPTVPLWALKPGVLVAGVRALVGGVKPTYTKGDDTLALGVDVIVDKRGEIAFLHRAKDAADRAEPADLVRRVQELSD